LRFFDPIQNIFAEVNFVVGYAEEIQNKERQSEY